MKENFCYIHIPFCTSKCKYCRFASFGNLDFLKINLYVEKLVDEINKSSFIINNNILKSIYFGGGTPSTLNTKQMEKIVKALKKKYIFDENIEINIEATPISITHEKLKGWRKIGVNRLSIGVQTLNTDSLNEIGRGEKGDIIKALNIINEYIDNKNEKTTNISISIDFIIGLPFVKKGELKANIEELLHNYYYVNHISVYMLEEYYEQGKIENKQGKKDSKFQNIVYPNDWKIIGIKDDDYQGEYVEIKSYLKSKGFYSYEISNFAKPGYECKHNKAYWNHSNIIPYGLGAHGLLNNVRISNSEEFQGYYSGNNQEYDILESDDLFIEKMMFLLRTTGLDSKIIEKLDSKKIQYFITEGLMKKKSDKIILSDSGILLMDYILGELI